MNQPLERRTRRGPRPLRVCHVAYTFYENDNRVIRYAETLAERGAEVHVIALRRPDQPRRGESNGVQVHRVQRRAVNERGPWSYLLKILWFFAQSTVWLTVLQLRRRFDVVHVHNVPDFLVFTAIVPRLTGAAIVLDIHDILPELYAGKFGTAQESRLFKVLLQVERLSCRFSDHVIVANHLWHEKLTRRAVPALKCTAMLNYPDLRLFTPRAGGPGRSSDRFVFLYPGTLNHHQGLDIAVDAFAAAHHQMPNAELHIYGEGPARPALARQVRELGLNGRVKLMDRVPLTDVCRVMADADVGVVPKRADGFGNEACSTKTLEFMACRVPVIASRTRVDEYYFNDSLVRFFTPGDPADLARAMLCAYRQPDGDRVERARGFALQNSWQKRAGEYVDIVERLVGRPSEIAVG